MKKLCYVKCKLCFILTLFAMIIGNADYAVAESGKVAIIPFKMNAEKDLTFLQNGIFDMLAFRISSQGKMSVISREDTEKAAEAIKEVSLNEIRAREIGARLNADYVVFGSLTIFGESVSISAKMADVAGEKPSITFFDQTREMGEVIPKINLFAMDINKMFGSAASQPAPVQPQAVKNEAPVYTEKPVSGDVSSGDRIQQKKAQNPAFIMIERHMETSGGFWKSKDVKLLINGLALGDVDGDGKNETVMITPHGIHVYSSENNRFDKMKEIKESRHKNFIGVDVADINGNGYSEIFITSLNAYKNGVNSLVFEWNGQNYAKIVEDSSWYYRVIELSGQGKILLGQKDKSDNPFSGEIFEMVWQNSSYAPEKKIVSSRHNNLIGLTFGDIMNNGQNVAVAYDKDDHIQIIDPSGNVIWTGSENYGGSNLYYLMPRTDKGTDNWQYLPMRLYIRDIDSDGKNEVIAVRNYEITRRLLSTFRKFTDAQIESLFWNGLGLAVNWKTQKISGHISDFAIGDFDNDGMDELVASVIIKDGAAIIGPGPKSAIIAYDLKVQIPDK